MVKGQWMIMVYMGFFFDQSIAIVRILFMSQRFFLIFFKDFFFMKYK